MVTNPPGRPPKPVRGNFYTIIPTDTMVALAAMKNSGRSWKSIALELSEKGVGKISSALVYRVTRGEIKSDRVEQALGLAPITAPAPICTNPTCDGYGQPHTYDCQTQALINKPAEQRRKGKPRKRHPYYASSQTDIEQVARQLEKYWPEWELIRKDSDGT